MANTYRQIYLQTVFAVKYRNGIFSALAQRIKIPVRPGHPGGVVTKYYEPTALDFLL